MTEALKEKIKNSKLSEEEKKFWLETEAMNEDQEAVLEVVLDSLN